MVRHRSHYSEFFFTSTIFLLCSSAVCGLVTIIPRIARNSRYSESLTIHESILGRNPSSRFHSRFICWLKAMKGSQTFDNKAYKKFRDECISAEPEQILKEEILNAYRLAGALGHQFLWVRLSLAFLISAVILLSIVLSVDINSKPTIQQCAENPTQFGVNKTILWRCSMFSNGGLAERCIKDPSHFGRNLTECSKLIPPSVDGSSTTHLMKQ
jgi:hypothetical protein